MRVYATPPGSLDFALVFRGVAPGYYMVPLQGTADGCSGWADPGLPFLREMKRDAAARELEARAQAIRAAHAKHNPPK